MARRVAGLGKQATRRIGPILLRREMAAFLPAVALAGLWFGLAAMTLIGATALLVAWMSRPLGAASGEEDEITGLPLREEAEKILEARLDEAERTGRGTACIVLGLDDAETLSGRLGALRMAEVLRRTVDRLHGALREGDHIARLNGARFAIVLKPTSRLDLEGLIQLSARLQSAAEAPLSIGQQTLHVTVHIGFCQVHHLALATPDAMLNAAESAANDAAHHGTSAIRAYSPAIRQAAPPVRPASEPDVTRALESGQIQPLFQPQISTDTGEVSGFEVSGSWTMPDGNTLAGADLMQAITAAGVQERYGEVMLLAAINGLRAFDRNGTRGIALCLPIPDEQIENPKFATRLKWELDRFEISADRIRLVMPMDVLMQPQDGVVFRNLSGCTTLGCCFDLAGFGDSPLSANRLRELVAPRLRIDPSLVQGLGCDPSQQRLVSAIISLADGLGLDTLATSVSAIADHAMLSQLGCCHVQGSAIAHPMVLQDTFAWLDRHREKLSRTPGLPRLAGG